MKVFKKFKNYKKVKTNIKGRGSYTLWVADTPKKKSLGLSGIKSLPKKHGMIFVYDNDVQNSFTMKNTFIPLIIIFLDKNFEILETFKCKPQQKRSIIPSVKYRYVIEI